ncbi:MAG: hypothetical protein R3E08_04955 [Thiotrichaceae bacterium]
MSTSGFYAIYKSLENTEKVRILVGISADKNAFDLFTTAKEGVQLELAEPSHKEARDVFVQQVTSELEIRKIARPLSKALINW